MTSAQVVEMSVKVSTNVTVLLGTRLIRTIILYQPLM